jgi:hypothetical protein
MKNGDFVFGPSGNERMADSEYDEGYDFEAILAGGPVTVS